MMITGFGKDMKTLKYTTNMAVKSELFCNHEIVQFDSIRAVNPKDCEEVTIGPNLVICRTIKDTNFLIKPDQYKSSKAKWLIT